MRPLVCKVADFVVEFLNLSLDSQKYFENFLSGDSPEVSFEISEQDIQFEINAVDGKCTRINAELAAALRKFAYWMLDSKAFLLHSSLIEVNGTGICFAAPSGTGKTTHTRLWKQLLGDNMTVINGDKPIIRFFENEKYPLGYGTPWCGKERYGINGKVPIKHICFIERSDKNVCEKLEVSEILQLFFKQIFIKRQNPAMVSKTLKLADMFLNNLSVWKIKCNMDISAAKVAYNTIFKENANET